MSSIRRQSILSSILIYAGFAFGALNTYLFTRDDGPFTKTQYGLTGIFMALAALMMSLASMGMPAFIYKFFPYYKDHLPAKKNDQATWALLVTLGGFILVLIGGLMMKDLAVRMFENSPELVDYYYWIFPFGLGLAFFTVLEALAWQHHRSVLSIYFKELQFRVFVTILFILVNLGLIRNFDLFIKIYSFLYIAIALALFVYLFATGRIHFTFSVSKVTRRFSKKILTLSGFVWSGTLIYTIASVADTMIIAGIFPDGVAMAGLFTFAQYLSSLVQAPQRSIIAASIAHLSQAWKDKNYEKIKHIYQRSSINQLIFSLAMFFLILMNYHDAITTFRLQEDYQIAFQVFLFMGLVKIVDMGTGVSGQIIATSTYWRFDFLTGVILLAVMLPLTWILSVRLGLIGPAVSNLIAYSIYNLIRYIFLVKKFGMQPFSIKSLYSVFFIAACFAGVYFLFNDRTGFEWLVIRSTLFLSVVTAGVYFLKLTPDLAPLLGNIARRIKK